MKQDLHKSISFDKEAVILYALTKGYLDTVEFENIYNFENALYRELDTSEKGIAISKHIKETKELPSDTLLDEFIKDCKRKFI